MRTYSLGMAGQRACRPRVHYRPLQHPFSRQHRSYQRQLPLQPPPSQLPSTLGYLHRPQRAFLLQRGLRLIAKAAMKRRRRLRRMMRMMRQGRLSVGRLMQQQRLSASRQRVIAGRKEASPLRLRTAPHRQNAR